MPRRQGAPRKTPDASDAASQRRRRSIASRGRGGVAGVARAQRLVEAVEVRSARGDQAVPPGERREGVPPLRRVIGAVHLDPAQAGLREAAHERRQRVRGHAQRGGVGQRRRAAGRAHQSHRLLGAEALVRNGGGPAVVEEAVEGVLAVARVTGGHDRVGDVRPADRPAGAGLHVGQVDGGAGRGEPRHDPLRPGLPRPAHLLQAVAQGLGRLLAEVSQQVQRARGRAHGQLHPGHHPHAQAGAGRDGLGHPAQRVVVGHRQHPHPRVRGQLHQRRRRQGAVGGEGVGVEVGPAGRCGYAATARPMRPRASSSPTTSAALSSGVSVSVARCTSGLGGASYGSLTPVNSLISPENALA